MNSHRDDRAAGREASARPPFEPMVFDRPIAGSALAIGAVAVAFAATALAWPAMRPTPWASFFAAVMASAWLGGLRPAMLATALAAVLGNLSFIGPHDAPETSGARAVSTLVFVGGSGFIGFLAAARRRSEARERRQRGWIQAAVSSIGDAVIVADETGCVRLMNPVAGRLTGWEPAEAVGQPLDEVFRVVVEATRRSAENPAPRALRERLGAGPADRTTLVARDGTEIPIDDSAAPVRDEAGAVRGMVRVFRDATGRRAAEVENERVVAALDGLADGFWRLDRDWRFVNVNAEAGRSVGLAPSDLIGRTLWEAFPAAVGTQVEAQYRRAAAERVTVEFENHDEPLGRWFGIKAFPTEDGGLAVLTRDITERKGADEEIRRLNQQLGERVDELQALLDILPAGIWQGDAGCERIAGNRAGYRMLGLSGGVNVSVTAPEVLAGKWPGFRCVVDGREVPPEELPMQRAARTGRPVLDFDHDVVFDDGREISLNCNVAPIVDEEGRVRAVLGAYIDITARKRAERDLRASEERFRLAAEALDGLIYDYDLVTGRIERTRGLYEVLGYRPDEVPATADWWLEQIHPDDLPGLRRKYERLEGQGVRSTYRVRHRDGRWLHVEDSAVIARDGDGKPVRLVGCTTDVTDRKRAEDVLVRERELLRTIIERIPAMLAVYEPGTRLLRLNPEFERITGWTSAEAAGVSLMEEFYPDPEYRERVGAFMRSGRDGWMDIRMRTRDGHDVETSWANIRLSDDTQVGIGIDLTERRRTEEQVRRLAAIIEATPDFVAVCEPGGRMSYLNRAGRRMVGIPEGADLASSARGAPCPPFVDERTLEEWLPVARRDGSVSGEAALRGADGRDVPVLFVLLVHREEVGGGESISMVARDITERKEAEAALKDADRRKDQFLATLAHELRNPLAPIRSAVQVLQMKDWPDPDLAWGRDVIERQVVQMARLLDDLLDVSRITRGKLELRRSRVALAKVVEGAVETSRPLIEGGGHDLEVALPEDPVYLDADPVRLAQVFSNLLNNAAKYTERGGRIRLDAGRRAGEVVVSVKDTGIGLAPDMMPRLFQVFSQAAPAMERAQGGLGIGLSLVKGLVEMHGGSVEARSDGPGRGSEFVVRLPVADATPAREPRPAGLGGPPAAGRKIVVADDNRDAAVSLARLLEIMGNEVRRAGDGQEAVEVAEAFRPDVVLLDIGMPRLNGYEAARCIRERPWGRDMVLVALTGWGQEEDKQRSQEAGFDAHMTKPVDPRALAEFLGSVARPAGMGLK